MNWRPNRGSVMTLFFITLLTLLLAGCSGDDDGSTEPFDISTSGKLTEVTCAQVTSVANAVSALAEAEAPGRRNDLRDWGLNPDNSQEIDEVRQSLTDKVSDCNNEEDVSTLPSESPPLEKKFVPADIVGWDDIVENPPEGLKATINKQVDYNWSDVTTWAKAELPSGSLADARVVLVFKQDGLSDEEARSRAKIDEEVPVLRVSSCKEVAGNGCPSGKAVQVILAPLVLDTNGQVEALEPGSGVVMMKGVPFISYDQ